MLMGQFQHSLDSRKDDNTSKFRELLGDSFVLTKGLDGCLLYTLRGMGFTRTRIKESTLYAKRC